MINIVLKFIIKYLCQRAGIDDLRGFSRSMKYIVGWAVVYLFNLFGVLPAVKQVCDVNYLFFKFIENYCLLSQYSFS